MSASASLPLDADVLPSPPLNPSQSPLASSLARCLQLPAAASCPWYHSVHVVTFDTDVGHLVEMSIPSACLSGPEELALSLAAMPDSQPSTSNGLGDSSFAFRFHRDGAPALWGFAFFRARRDPSLPRGTFQKSFVLLCSMPFFRFMRTNVVPRLAETYFGGGSAALQASLQEMQAWPPPPPLPCTVTVTLASSTLAFTTLPCEVGPAYAVSTTDHGGLETALLDQSFEACALREARAVGPLCNLGAACWSLWQLLIMGESIIILTPSPHHCSDIVLALPALISPLPCMSHMHPYLTVHAPDWDDHLAGPPPPGSGHLIGATNPMLARDPPAWLSLLVLEEREAAVINNPARAPGHRRSSSGGLARNHSAGSLAGALFGLSGDKDYFSRFFGSKDGLGAMWTSATWTSTIDLSVRADERVLRRLGDTSASKAEGTERADKGSWAKLLLGNNNMF